MDVQNGKRTAVMMLILSGLALFASLKGVFDPTLYHEVYLAGTIPEGLIWGSQAQDIISILFAVLLAVFTLLYWKNESMKIYIMMLGLTWYFFYAFGLYTIQGQYTSIYLVYLAIFGLSFYSLVYGVLGIKPAEAYRYELPNGLRKAIGIFIYVMIAFLYPVWIMRIVPDIASHVPGQTYAVFILDLCLIFPAVGIIAYLLLKKKPLGVLLAGMALLKIFTLCLSWTFGELTNPLAGNTFTPEMAILSSALTLCSLIFFVPYILKLKKV